MGIRFDGNPTNDSIVQKNPNSVNLSEGKCQIDKAHELAHYQKKVQKSGEEVSLTNDMIKKYNELAKKYVVEPGQYALPNKLEFKPEP